MPNKENLMKLTDSYVWWKRKVNNEDILQCFTGIPPWFSRKHYYR